MTRLEFHTSTLWREASIEWQYYLAGEHGACRHVHFFRAQPMMHHAPHGIAGTDLLSMVERSTHHCINITIVTLPMRHLIASPMTIII